VNQAKTAAAGKSVGVHGADTIQQCLNAGLLDEIRVDIAAVLLGSGDSSTTSPARQSSLATRR
jgi:dihydrofolate reductase